MMTDVLTQLIAAYDEAPTASRAGAARTLAEVAPLFSPVHVDTVLRFLLTRYADVHCSQPHCSLTIRRLPTPARATSTTGHWQTLTKACVCSWSGPAVCL